MALVCCRQLRAVPPPFCYLSSATSTRQHHGFSSPSLQKFRPLRNGPISARRNRNAADSITNFELEKGLARPTSGNALYVLLLANLGVYALDHWLQVDGVKLLYLYHAMPRWYQFITATFCHSNWSHLSSNLFFLYIFGKLVEEEEGGFALWASYIITGVGANIVSWLVLPPSVVSVGASGAVFGLFAISVLVKVGCVFFFFLLHPATLTHSASLVDNVGVTQLSWDWRKILEVVILGQFVVDKVMQASASLAGPASSINHVAHCAGALLGVVLIWLLSKLPSDSSSITKK